MIDEKLAALGLKRDPEDPAWLLDDKGVSYYGPREAVVTGALGFCACGRPQDALAYIAAGLRLIATRRDYFDPAGRLIEDAYRAHTERERAHFGSGGAATFFWYWCAKEELTEHGGSVPGWLSDHGEALLAALDALPVEEPQG